jgi:mitochondrial fission protein ELM1
LLTLLDAWQALGGAMMLSASRRTPAAWRARLRHWAERHGARYYDGTDAAAHDNPYLGFIAHAQRIVVTADSVNMLSEACATGKPVFVHVHRPLRGKLERFYRELLESSRVRPLRAAPSTWTPTPLRECRSVADEVWRRYRARRS